MNSLLCAASQHLIVPPPIFLPGQVLSIDPRQSDTNGQELQEKSPFAHQNTSHGVRLSNDIPDDLHPINRSMYFSGSAYHHLEIPSHAFTPTLASDFTLELYFKPEVHRNATGALLAQWVQNAAGGNFALYVNNGRVVFTYGPYSKNVGLLELGTLTQGQWYHIAVCRYGSMFYGLVNGRVVATGSTTGTRGPLDVPGYAGVYLNGKGTLPQDEGVPLQGHICKIGIFDYCKYGE